MKYESFDGIIHQTSSLFYKRGENNDIGKKRQENRLFIPKLFNSEIIDRFFEVMQVANPNMGKVQML